MILDKKIPFTHYFKLIIWDMVSVLIVSISAHFISNYLLQQFTLNLSISVFLGTAISLLLSFKLSQSYDRWWEARKIWGAIVNDSRSLIIQLINFTSVHTSGDIPTEVKTIAHRQIAWCYALGQSLRKLNPTAGIDHLISEKEFKSMEGQKNVPMSLMNLNTKNIIDLHEGGYLNDFQQVQIDNTTVRLVASMGMAERIKNTVFPTSYRQALHLFIFIFLIILSFSLTDVIFWFEIPLLVAIAMPFFLMEKIAFRMQDPFENRESDTSMTAIARTIEINIRQLLKEQNIPDPYPSDNFYIM